jgi:hypothetical protein
MARSCQAALSLCHVLPVMERTAAPTVITIRLRELNTRIPPESMRNIRRLPMLTVPCHTGAGDGTVDHYNGSVEVSLPRNSTQKAARHHSTQLQKNVPE